MPKSTLPFGSEFSPSQVDLQKVLELAAQHDGDWRAFEDAVRTEYFESHKTSVRNQRKLANNTKLGMQAYGLIDKEGHLTKLGRELYELREEKNRLHERLAQHILHHLHGVNLVQCVLDMQVAGETVTLQKLRIWLDERGIHFPRGGKHPSIMKLWLQKAGVFSSEWQVDIERFEKLAGITEVELEALAELTSEQIAYVKTLVNIGEEGPFPSNEIERLASATYGVVFNEKNLPKDILYPLEKIGYIELERGTRQAGRGAKPFLVSRTRKLEKDVVLPILDQIEKQVAPGLRRLLRRPLSEILRELKSKDHHKGGLALEALAFKLMRLLDMNYVATRLRGAETGGAEVDLIFEAERLVFSRWQIQCKNTAKVSLDDVAKEVGLTHSLKSNVIVMVTTGEIGPEAKKFANKVMGDTNLCIVMLNGADLERIKDSPATIVDAFHREAIHASKLKALQMKEDKG
ncbi:MAG: restriction endonuclease [Euryarchaeota archaeon]|nr:restriction endonuclease [Euryarchaeota archaeon]